MYYKNRPMIWSYDFMYIKSQNMYYANRKGSMVINVLWKSTIMNIYLSYSILNGTIYK